MWEKKHLLCDGNTVTACNFGVSNQAYYRLEKALEKKTISLNSEHYGQFDTNGLFIYNSGSFFFEGDEKRIRGKAEELKRQYKKWYRYLFVYCSNEIYMIDVDMDTVDKRNISGEQFELIQDKTIEEVTGIYENK